MKERRIAKIENDFIFKAHYALSAVEQKIVLFLASRIDPLKDKKFIKQVVPIKHIERILWEGETVGNPYAYLQEIVGRLLDRKIFFPKGAIIGGKKIYAGGINWFQSILVQDTEEGIGIEFMFAERMKPFLLELNEYVRINAMEVMDMRGKHAIRMYQIFKAERERTKKYKTSSCVTYGIPELKAMLGIENKYKVFNNFKRRVLDPMKEEINTYSQEISIDYECLKTRRKITGVDFLIYDKREKKLKTGQNVDLENYVPSKEDIEKLSYSQEKAYKVLVKFGVYGGIAYRQILPTIKGANMEGFEDTFCEQAIKIFKTKEKPKKDAKTSVAVFVKWWTDKKVFDNKSDLFYLIAEKVHEIKKQMGQERLDNRSIAKDMTAGEFEKWYKEQQAEQEQVQK